MTYCLNCKKELTYKQILKKNSFCSKGCATSFRQKANDPNFMNFENEFKYYVIGFIFADGNLNKEETRITIRSSDLDLINIIYNDFCDKQKRIIYKEEYNSPNQRTSYAVINSNPDVIKSLKEIGLFSCKSYTMKFPKIPNEYIGPFIRGYFDGDGCVYISNKHNDKNYYAVSFTSGSKEFLEELQQTLLKYDISSTLSCDSRANNNSFLLKIYKQKDIKTFKVLIYENSQIYLKRKYDIFMNDIV